MDPGTHRSGIQKKTRGKDLDQSKDILGLQRLLSGFGEEILGYWIGMGLAEMTLLESINPGKCADCLQWDSMRQIQRGH